MKHNLIAAHIRGEAFHTASGDGWQKFGTNEVKDHGEHFSLVHQTPDGHHLAVIKKGADGGQLHFGTYPTREQAKETAEKIVAGQPTPYDDMPAAPTPNL